LVEILMQNTGKVGHFFCISLVIENVIYNFYFTNDDQKVPI